jgi:hypothetical protein
MPAGACLGCPKGGVLTGLSKCSFDRMVMLEGGSGAYLWNVPTIVRLCPQVLENLSDLEMAGVFQFVVLLAKKRPEMDQSYFLVNQ